MPDPLSLLAEPNRRRLLELLASGEQTAGQLAVQFTVTRSAISQHLTVLAGAGLVQVRPEGRRRYYRLDPDGMAVLRHSLEAFWVGELDELVRSPTTRSKVHMVEKSVIVPLGPEETFALITEPERLRRWHTVSARIDLRVGGEYRFTIVPGHIAKGTVTEIEPGRHLRFSFGWEGDANLPPGASTVEISLEPVAGGTLVRLVHDGLTEEQATGHGVGWEHYLGRLAAAAVSGDAGPDAWAAAPDPMDELAAAEASLAICERALRGITPADLDRSTPCSKYDLRALVDHLIGSLEHLACAAGGAVVRVSDPSVEVEVADAAGHTLELWRSRGLEGTVHVGPNELPAELAAGILAVELLVHAWDVGATTGIPVEVSEPLADYVLGVARKLVPAERDGDQFGPEVLAGEDANSIERLAAFTGRAI